ncbi:NAD-dependent epimerase/dehydratase family protein [Rhizobium sp. RCAM05350]|nr:NAD-dependent epimerase/dehydratase family protein [Rhizobium sp. RCAM05350]
MVAIDRQLPVLPAGVAGYSVEMSDYEGLVSAFSGCDALIHMAAIPSPRALPDHYVHANNVVGSYNAMRAAIEAGISRICQGSSVNALGLAYAQERRFDYFPVDELHPTYCDEGYSLSKWICEQQADSLTRRFTNLSIASLRFHWVVADRGQAAAQTLTSEKGRVRTLGLRARCRCRACLPFGADSTVQRTRGVLHRSRRYDFGFPDRRSRRYLLFTGPMARWPHWSSLVFLQCEV